MGIFAKKAPRQATHRSNSVSGLVSWIICIKREGVFVVLLRYRTDIRRGIEVVSV